METFHKECMAVVTRTLKDLESLDIHPLPQWFSTGLNPILKIFIDLRNDLYENNNSYSYQIYMEMLAYSCYETANIFKSLLHSLSSAKFWLEKCLECLQDCESENPVYESNGKESLKSCANELFLNISEILNSQNASYPQEDIHGRLLMCLALLQFDITVPPAHEKNQCQAESCHKLSVFFEIVKNPEMQSFYEKSHEILWNHILNELETKPDFIYLEGEIEKTIKSEIESYECTLEEVIAVVCENLNISDKLDSNEESFITKLYMSHLLREFFFRAEEGVKLFCKEGLSTEEKLKIIENMEELTSLELIPSIDILNRFSYAKLIPLYINKFDRQEGHRELQQFRFNIVEMLLKDLEQCKPEIDFISKVANCFMCIKDLKWFLDESLLDLWYERQLDAWEKVLSACKQLKARNTNEEGCLTALWSAANALTDTKDFKLKLQLRSIISNIKTASAETVKLIELKGNRKVIEVVGQFIRLSRVSTEINRFLCENVSIQEVRFFGAKVMYVDEDVNWPGINVAVNVRKLFVEEIRGWNLSGRNSDHTFTSDAASEKEGADGRPGESGGNVDISAESIVNPKLLTITSNGGKGSNGQNGGYGVNGADGVGMTLDDFKTYFPNTAVGGETKKYVVYDKTMRNIHNASTSYKNSTFKEGVTNVGAGHEITFFCSGFWRIHALCLVKGTKGTKATSGKEGGLGGQGGFPGCVNASTPAIKIYAAKGDDGENGDSGSDGCHGKDGWDVGYIDKELSSYYPIYYGENHNTKLNLATNSSEGDGDWVYSNNKNRWYSFKTSSITTPKKHNHPQKNKNQQQRARKQHANATRKNNVSETNAASKYAQFNENFEENYLNSLETDLTLVQQKGLSVLENISLSEEVELSYTATTRATYSARDSFGSWNIENKTKQANPKPKLRQCDHNDPVDKFIFDNFLELLLKKNEKALREFPINPFDFNQISIIARQPNLRNILSSKLQRQKYLNAFYYELAKIISADVNFVCDYKHKISETFLVDPLSYLTEKTDSFILEEDGSNFQSNFEFASENVRSKVGKSFQSHAEKQSVEWKVCLKLFCSEVEHVIHEDETVDKFVLEYSKFSTSVQQELTVLVKDMQSLFKSMEDEYGWIFSKMMKIGQTNAASILQFFEERLTKEDFTMYKKLYCSFETILTKEFDFKDYFQANNKDIITAAIVSQINSSGTDSNVYKELLARDSSCFIRVYFKSNDDDTLQDVLQFEDYGDPKCSNVSYFLENKDSHLIPLKINPKIKKLHECRKIMARFFKHILSDPEISTVELDSLLDINPSNYVAQMNKNLGETHTETNKCDPDTPNLSTNAETASTAPDLNTKPSTSNTNNPDLCPEDVTTDPHEKKKTRSRNNYHWYSLVQMHSQNELHYIETIKSFLPTAHKLIPRLEKLTNIFLGPNLILAQIYNRFQSEGCQISESTLEFLISSILNWKTSCSPCIKIVTWILASYPQNNWADEVFILELEDFYAEEMSSEQKTKWRQILTLVENKMFYILIKLKLDKNTQTKTTVLEVKEIIKGLGRLKNYGSVLDELQSRQLNDWMYTIHRQHWVDQVNSISNVTDEEINEIVFYLTDLQNLHGLAKTEELYHLLKHLEKSRILKLLEEFYNNENILQNTNEEGVSNLNLEKIEKGLNSIEDKDRDAETLVNMIEKCANTCEEFKTTVLPTLMNDIKIPLQPSAFIDFKGWAQSANSGTNLKDALQIVDFAIYKQKGYNLRDTQKIAILGLLKGGKSTLAQVSTGEGKTFIAVACTIISVALYKKTVEIVTSSTVLAKRDAKINLELYGLFGISVGHNCYDELEERKKSYAENQAIYSDLSGLQRDYLEDRILGKNVLGSRRLDCVFVDEVDSMLLDNGNTTLYLSHLIPLLEKLDTLYIYIWKTLLSQDSMEIDTDTDIIETLKRQVWSDLYGLLDKSQITSLGTKFVGMEEQIWNLLIKSNVIDKQGRLRKHVNQSMIQELQISLEGFPQLECRIKFLLSQTVSRQRFISVPNCLLEYIDFHLEEFIKSSVLALVMENKVDYVEGTDGADRFSTIIILNKDTGTDEKNAQWEEALHQFLLLKHGCKISPATLKSVYISNVSFFKLYRSLYGLSGTLGSQEERDLLKEIHNVQIFTVPTSKPRKFKELPPVACSNDGEWIQAICKATTDYCTTKGRSVLTVSETIKLAETISEAMEDNEDGVVVETYTRDYEDFKFGDAKELPPGYDINSTNLAGRGTDISLEKKVKDAGGLVVIVTNISKNKRTLQQAFGRASRGGEPGSGQLIVKSENIYRERMEQVEAESHRLAEVKADYEERIKKEEDAFSQFFKVYQTCQKKLIGQEKQLEDILLTGVLDQWAFWLDKNAERLKTHPSEINEFLEKLRSLKMDSYEDWLNGDIIRLTSLGKYLAYKEQHSQANSIFDNVINSDPTQAAMAHYYKAYNLGKEKSSSNAVIKHLSAAKQLFTQLKEKPILLSAIMKNLTKKNASCVQTKAFDTQQENISSIYSAFINSCDDILGRDVTPQCFENYNVNRFMAKKLFEDLLMKGVITKPSFDTNEVEAIEEVSQTYGISKANLITVIEASEGDPVLFRKKMKAMNFFPSRELYWKLMVKLGVFVDEVKLVSLRSTELQDIDSALYSKLKELKTACFAKRQLVLYPAEQESSTDEDILTFEKTVFKDACGLQHYKYLKQIELLNFNKFANFSATKIDECKQLEHFDLLIKSDMGNTGIPEEDREEVLNQLVEKKILITTENGFKLNTPFSEIKKIYLEKFPIYDSATLFLLYNRFAFRIAHEELTEQNSDGADFKLNLHPLPSTQIYFDLKEKDVFTGSKLVEIDEDKLVEKLSMIQNHLIGQTDPASSHHSKLSPFEIKTILNVYQKWSEDTAARKSIATTLLQTVGTIQSIKNKNFLFRKLSDQVNTPEILSFQVLGFHQLIFIDEKKWTREMKWNCIAVVIIGICQIAVGLVLQLCSGGLLGFVGQGLVQEGVGDLLFSISCMCSGHFSWKKYGEHKKLSLMLTCATVGVGAFLSKGTKVSSFGKKLAHPELMAGENYVCQMTGMTLVRTVGKEAVAMQMTKSLVKKTGKAIAIGVVNEGVDRIVQNYFQGLCNQVASGIIGEIEKAISDHKVSNAIEQVIMQFGCEEGMKLIRDKSESFFAETTSSKIKGIALQIKCAISQGVDLVNVEIGGLAGKVVKVAKILDKTVTFIKWADKVYEVFFVTNSFLNSTEKEISKELEKKERTVNELSPEELEHFKKQVAAYWQKFLKEEIGKLVSQNFVSPLLTYVAQKCLQNVNKVVKHGYAAIMAGIQNGRVEDLKYNYQRKLDSLRNGDCFSKEEQQLKQDYENSLIKILKKTKSPKVFSKIVQEDIPLDLTCVQACANMVQQYLKNQQNLSGMEVNIKVIGDNGYSQDFLSSSGGGNGQRLQINLELKDNHFSLSGLSSNCNKPAGGNNCLLDCLKSSVGLEISADEFRSGLSREILNCKDMKYSIRQGWHSLPTKLGLIGGYKNSQDWRLNTNNKGYTFDGEIEIGEQEKVKVKTKSTNQPTLLVEQDVVSASIFRIPFNVGMGKGTDKECQEFAKRFIPPDKNGKYLACHMVSASLGGGNSIDNMIPGTRSFNAVHFTRFEKRIQTFLDDETVMNEHHEAAKNCKPYLIYKLKANYVHDEFTPSYVKDVHISIELKNSYKDVRTRFEDIFKAQIEGEDVYKESTQIGKCKFNINITNIIDNKSTSNVRDADSSVEIERSKDE